MSYLKIKKSIHSETVEKVIADFENQVDFEFIPVIAYRSSYVEHITWILSLLIMLLFIGIIDYSFAHYLKDSWLSPLPFYLGSPFIALICGFILDKSDLVDRFFISKKERVRQVEDKAELFFYRNNLQELKSKHAILLYISIMERHIVLFHDPRISISNITQIDQDLLKLLQQSFKNKDYQSGLIKAIHHLLNEIKPYYPVNNSKPSENQIPNKIIWIS